MRGELERRTLLAAAGMAVPTAVAGCVSDVVPGTGGGDRPSYANWLPAESTNDEQGVMFVYAALGELEDVRAGEVGALPDSAQVDPQNEDMGDADPLGAIPVLGLFVLALSAGFGLWKYQFGTNPLSGFGGGDGATTATATPTPSPTATGESAVPASVLLVDGVFVIRGSFSAGEVTSGMEGFEVTDERDGYAVYEGTGGEAGTEGLAFAVNEGTLVVPTAGDDADLRPRLEAVLDVRHGDATSLAAADEDVDWLLRTAGAGQVAVGAWDTKFEGDQADAGPDPVGQLGQPRGLVGGLTLQPTVARGRFAAVYQRGETPTVSEVKNVVGTSADDRSVSVDGTRVSVEGSWNREEST